MLKDWKKFKGNKNKFGLTYFYKKGRDYVIVNGNKNPKERNIQGWNIQISTSKELKTYNFKTKLQAIAYAKGYMRKH